jgi:hypothetical protein
MYLFRILIISAFIALVSNVPVQAGAAASERTFKQPVVHQLPAFFRRTQNQAEADQGVLALEHQSIVTRVGDLVKFFEPVLKGHEITSDIDTLGLLQACRRFESLMQEIGERRLAKDLEGNIEKVLDLYQQTPPDRRKTVSALLEYEKAMGIHGPHGLKDPSAAIGILWIRRSLSFQSKMYKSLLEPGMDPKHANMAAYKSELQPYHGWALQQLYKLSLQSSAPSRKEMLVKFGGFEGKHFGEEEEQATLRDIRYLLSTWRPIIGRCKQIYTALGLEDKRRV